MLTTCSRPAYAAESLPLTIDKASITGDTLHIEVTDSKTKITSVLDFDLQDYPATSEYITIQAVNANGNKSDVARVKNPRYVPPKETVTETADITQIVETSVQSNGAFTPDGAGSVMDDIVNGSKEFFTITTVSNNTFYLIIDRQRNSENVYLLNAVTEQDLLDFIRKNNKDSDIAVTTTEAFTKPPQTSETVAETTETPQKTSKNNNGTIIIIIIVAAAVGGGAYYFKIYKPKHTKVADENEELDIIDETDENVLDGETDGDEID